MSFASLNEDLDRVSRDIESTTYDVDIAREAFLIKEAEYDNAYSHAILCSIANNSELTQTDLKAMATAECHPLNMDRIMAKSTYMKAQNRLKALRDRLDALKELGYNLRREAQIR